jgi:NADPH:quinone reductase
MKAICIKEFGGIENLEYCETSDLPKPEGDEVLIRVKAAGINRADILQRKGLYPAPDGYPQNIPGLEFAGEIADKGLAAGRFGIGARVFGITGGGAQAEFLLIKESQLMPIPENLNFIQAACIPEAFITAHDALFTQGVLKKGESCLIHAVGSGVGLAALQLCKAKGIRAIGTSRNIGKLEKCKEFGLDRGILANEELSSDPKVFAKRILEANNDGGINVILDLAGAAYFQANLLSLGERGRLMLIGLISGRKAEFDLGIALSKRLKIIGTTLRGRSCEEKALATAKFAADILQTRSNRRGPYFNGIK